MSYRVRHPEMQQEEDVVPRKGVFAFIALVLVVGAVMVVWAVSVVTVDFRELRPSGAFTEKWLGPRHLVSRVRQDLFDERGVRPSNEIMRRDLETWGWVDRGRGIVRVPIDEAMDLVVKGQRP
jgi:hypothetical protein